MSAAIARGIWQATLQKFARQRSKLDEPLGAQPARICRVRWQHYVPREPKTRTCRFARILLPGRHKHQTFSKGQQDAGHEIDRRRAETLELCFVPRSVKFKTPGQH